MEQRRSAKLFKLSGDSAQPRVPEIVAKLVAEQAELLAASRAQCERPVDSAATSDSFPAAAGRSDVVGESSSDRDPLQMPLRAFVRSILLLLWTGHGWSQFLLLVSRNAALFTRTVSSSIESQFFVYHTSRQ